VFPTLSGDDYAESFLRGKFAEPVVGRRVCGHI
jgi:hypothetical protein